MAKERDHLDGRIEKTQISCGGTIHTHNDNE